MKKYLKIIIFAGLIGLVLLLNHLFGWSDSLRDNGGLAFLKTQLEQNKQLAMLLYVGLTIVGCVVLALPGITFALIAGVLFGPLWGTVLCSLATTIGAVLAFITGRFFLKDAIKPLVMKNKYLRRILFSESGRNDIFVLMITRLVPLFPYNLQNFAYGITDISLWHYTLYSFLFMIPGTAMYTIGAAGLADARNRWLYIALAVVLAVLVILLGRFLKKKYVGEEGHADES